jgi:hypothetical protein
MTIPEPPVEPVHPDHDALTAESASTGANRYSGSLGGASPIRHTTPTSPILATVSERAAGAGGPNPTTTAATRTAPTTTLPLTPMSGKVACRRPGSQWLKAARTALGRRSRAPRAAARIPTGTAARAGPRPSAGPASAAPARGAPRGRRPQSPDGIARRFASRGLELDGATAPSGSSQTRTHVRIDQVSQSNT